jgi:hypothetical protein
MVTVTMNETPTEQVLAKALETVSVPDSRGRMITLRKPGILAQYRLVEVAGDSASNETYMRMILPLIYVTEIDGDPITQPVNKKQLEALIQRLDEHGIEAVNIGAVKNWGAPNPDADKAEIKK